MALDQHVGHERVATRHCARRGDVRGAVAVAAPHRRAQHGALQRRLRQGLVLGGGLAHADEVVGGAGDGEVRHVEDGDLVIFPNARSALDPRQTPNRSQIDPGSIPNRPQEHKMKDNRGVR